MQPTALDRQSVGELDVVQVLVKAVRHALVVVVIAVAVGAAFCKHPVLLELYGFL